MSCEQACEESTLTLACAIDLASQVYKKVISSDTAGALDGSTLTGSVLNQAIASQLRKCLGVI